jgi:hypothetical protein
MSDGPGLGFSKLEENQFRASGVDRLKKAAIFLVAFVLLGIFFLYLTKEVQTSSRTTRFRATTSLA